MSRLSIVLVLLLASTFAMAEKAQVTNTRHYFGSDAGAFAMGAKAPPAAEKSPATTEKAPATADKAQLTGSQKAASAPQKSNPADYREQPFDSSVSSLSAPIRGNDIRQLYSQLVAISSDFEQKKSETAEQYNDRTSKIDKCKLGANIRCDSTLAFYDRAVLDSKYDADSQTMAITFSLSDESLYSSYRRDAGQYAIVEISDNTVSERYAVKNASGASTDVIRTKGETWALSIGVSDLEPIISKAKDMHYECKLNVKMPVEWVQEFKDGILKDVGLLYVGILDSDPAYEDRDYGAAMMSVPYTKDVKRYSIKFKLGEIWVVNKATGRIYGKHSVGAVNG